MGVVLRSGDKKPWEDVEGEYQRPAHDESIRQGSFGRVYRRKHVDPVSGAQTLVVIKEVKHRAAESARQEEHELECIRRLSNHRLRGHFIEVLNVFHRVDLTGSGSRVVANIIVMESGICDLEHVKRSHGGHGTSTVQTWMGSLARAVRACHESQVMHRDIKPGNCIMCVGQQTTLDLKLADFGNSVVVTTGPPIPGASFELEWSTTPEYCAPELFRGFHAFQGDAWPIGVICAEFFAHGASSLRRVVPGQPSLRGWQTGLGGGSAATQHDSANVPGH